VYVVRVSRAEVSCALTVGALAWHAWGAPPGELLYPPGSGGKWSGNRKFGLCKTVIGFVGVRARDVGAGKVVRGIVKVGSCQC
jgi:hypothetical protein